MRRCQFGASGCPATPSYVQGVVALASVACVRAYGMRDGCTEPHGRPRNLVRAILGRSPRNTHTEGLGGVAAAAAVRVTPALCGPCQKAPAKALQNRPCSPWFHASGGALRGRAGGENRPAPRPTHVARAWPPRLGHGMACTGLPAVCAPKTRDFRRNGSLDLASAPRIKFWPAARRNLVPLMLRRRHQSRLARRPLSAT